MLRSGGLEACCQSALLSMSPEQRTSHSSISVFWTSRRGGQQADGSFGRLQLCSGGQVRRLWTVSWLRQHGDSALALPRASATGFCAELPVLDVTCLFEPGGARTSGLAYIRSFTILIESEKFRGQTKLKCQRMAQLSVCFAPNAALQSHMSHRVRIVVVLGHAKSSHLGEIPVSKHVVYKWSVHAPDSRLSMLIERYKKSSVRRSLSGMRCQSRRKCPSDATRR